MQGDEKVIQKSRKTKCGKLFSGWSGRLYKKYKQLRETESEEFARDNYPKKLCTHEQWLSLIDTKWSDPKFQVTYISLM